MFFFSGRDEAATPTPSLNNVETVSFDEEGNTAVKLGYHYKGTAEQIQEEKRKNALYEGAADKGKGEFHPLRSLSSVGAEEGVSTWFLYRRVASHRLPFSLTR